MTSARSRQSSVLWSARNVEESGGMKITHVETLLSKGKFAQSNEWAELRSQLHEAIKRVDWPPGSGKFTIYPQSGKKTGEGNGVGPGDIVKCC